MKSFEGHASLGQDLTEQNPQNSLSFEDFSLTMNRRQINESKAALALGDRGQEKVYRAVRKINEPVNI